MMRLTATLLSLALIQVSFGPEAWAQLVSQVGAVAAPVGGASAAAGSTNAGGSANSAAIALPSRAPLTASPLAAPSALFSAPSAVASLPASAIGAGGMAAGNFAAAAPPAATLAAEPAPTEDAAARPSRISAASPSKTVLSSIEAGPRAAEIGSRISRRFAELKSYFDGKNARTLPSEGAAADARNASGLKQAGQKPATAAAAPEPAAPTPSDKAANRKSIKWFLSGLLVAQVGVEVLALAMPLLMRSKFGGFLALAHIAVASSVAGIAGQLTGGWIADKVGVKTVYIGATALRLLSITGMVVFLMGPAAPLVAAAPPLAAAAAYLGHFSAQLVMIGFASFNGYMQGIAQTAEKSIPTVLLGNDRATMERFYSLQQWLTEIVGVSGPKAGGFIVQAFGFTAAIAVYPVMLTVAVAMFFLGVRVPKADGAHDAVEASKAGSLLSRVMAPMAPMNRAIADVFGRIAGRIKAVVDGVVLKAYLGRWIEKMGGKGSLTDDDEQKLLSRSTLGWTMGAMLALAGFLTLLLPTAYPAYAAMIVFGVAEVIATQKLFSLMLSRTQGKTESLKVNAVAGAALAAISTVALNLAGTLFDHFAGRAPFMIFAAALIPVAAAIFFLRRSMKKLDEKGAPEPAKRPTSGFGLLFKDPMMRWAFLGYALLGVTNPLLYDILSQAFGLIIVGGSAVAASGVASWMTSLYSLGGLLGALYMWRESTLISDAKKAPEAPSRK